MTKPKTIIETWHGPVVVNNDDYYTDIDEATQCELDDCWDYKTQEYDFDKVPEYAECCDTILPTYNASTLADEIAENMDENYPIADDATTFQDWLTPKHREKLQQLIDQWIAFVDWSQWQGNGKYIALRSEVIKYAKEEAISEGISLEEKSKVSSTDYSSIHTCHYDCPCHTGGVPLPDFAPW